MAADPPPVERRRPRPGSLERPVDGRLYRGTWLLVALPLLIAAFSVARPQPLPTPSLPSAFDPQAALGLARELSLQYPDRSAGSGGAIGATDWFAQQLEPYGFQTRKEPFMATVPGRGRVRLVNQLAVVPGRSPRAIVVMAHRDDGGIGPGANDNASGTAALIELARAYAKPQPTPGTPVSPRVHPTYTIIFLSTDGGALGGLGAAEFANHSPFRSDVVAVVNLDSVAGSGRPRLLFSGDTPRSPAAALLESAATTIEQQTRRQPERPSTLRQLIDLGFPYSPYEQAPFVARGIPAVTITTAHDRPPDSFSDTPNRLNVVRLGQLGRATQNLIGSLDQALDVAQGTSSYLFLGPRIVRGWAVELVLIAALLPFLAAAVDLFARCRRRRIRIAPGLRSYRSRLLFWLWSGALFGLFAVLGVWPKGTDRPPPLTGSGGEHWPAAGLLGLGALMAISWLVARDRLIPRRSVTPEEELGGYTAALLALGIVGLLVVATNPYALVFLLPSLHIWLWLPQTRYRAPWIRALVLLGGLLGPALLLWSFGSRYGLGFDAPWYIAELVALGFVPLPAFVITLAWAAAGSQLAAITAGRYAPYPAAGERPRRGPLRESVRRIVLAQRRRRRASERARQALEG
jgi:hypothetical protein